MSTHVDDLIAHPQRHFAQPREVLEDPRLTATEKIKVLESWRLDAARLAESTAENMSGGEETDLREVSRALLELKAVEPEVLAQSRQGKARRSGPSPANMASGLALGAALGASTGLVAVALTGPSLAVVAQATLVGLILGGVVTAVRGAAV